MATPADIPAIAAIHVESWRANYRGMIPDETIDSRTIECRRTMWAQLLEEPQRITLVSCAERGIIAGFASAFLLHELHNGFDSFLQMIFVAEPFKRRGIGRELLAAIAGELHAAGAHGMALRTLRANPARGFYERLGAKLVADGIDVDEGEFDDVVYGFRDMNVLTRLSYDGHGQRHVLMAGAALDRAVQHVGTDLLGRNVDAAPRPGFDPREGNPKFPGLDPVDAAARGEEQPLGLTHMQGERGRCELPVRSDDVETGMRRTRHCGYEQPHNGYREQG